MQAFVLTVLLALDQTGPSLTVSGREPYMAAVRLEPGQAVVGSVDQGENDLAAALVGPDGRALVEFDSRERAAETFAFVATAAGDYHLRIRTVSRDSPTVPFRLQFEVRSADAPIHQRVLAATLHSEARQLFRKGDRESLVAALARFREVRPIWVSLSEREWEVAAVTASGDALNRMSDYASALTTYRDALAVCRTLADARSEGEILNNMAMVSWPLGEIDDAINWLSEAEMLWHSIGFKDGEAIAISNRGILSWEAGEYDDARQLYEKAMALFEAQHHLRGRAYALNNLAVLFDALGGRRQSLEKFREAIVLFRRAADPIGEGRAETRVARVFLALGNVADARRALDRALPLIQQSADRLAEADALAQRGRIWQAAKNGLLARADFHRSLLMYRELGSRRGAADALHDIGVSHAADGNAANAIGFLTEARDIRRLLGLRPVEAETLYQLAKAERARGNLEAARSNIESALDIVEALRRGVLEKQLRASYGESKETYYALYVDLLVECHRLEPARGFDRLAFEASERAKARGLIELLRESWSGVTAAAPAGLLSREQTLRKEINYWSWQLWQQAGRQGSQSGGAAESALTRLLAEHDEAVADIRRSDPRYSAILSPQSLAADVIQRELLAPGITLLSFQLGEPRSYLWVLTRDVLRVVELPSRHALDSHVRAYLATVNNPLAKPSVHAASVLAGELLQPAGPFKSSDRVVIVPDGQLNGVPFAALPWPGASSPPRVVVTPSATVLALLAREVTGRAAPPSTLAAIADPVFSADDPRVGRSRPAAADAPSQFSRLPYSRDEVDRILAMVPQSQRFRAVDFAASRATVTGPDLGQHRLVHFATHAVQNIAQPSLSGIVLSLVDAKGAKQNGFLRLQDIYNLRLRADLVVLSACETGAGTLVFGEGVNSLARGLFHAGAARVISTLWKVDDEATAYMMSVFYRDLVLNGLPASEALSRAQSAMRAHSRWSHPYYWAGFVLQGLW